MTASVHGKSQTPSTDGRKQNYFKFKNTTKGTVMKKLTRTDSATASSTAGSTRKARHSSCGTTHPSAAAPDPVSGPPSELPPPAGCQTSEDRMLATRTEDVRRAFRSGVVSLSQPMLIGLLASNQLAATYACVMAINEAIGRLGRTRIGREALYAPETMQMPALELARFVLGEALAILAQDAPGTTPSDPQPSPTSCFAAKSTPQSAPLSSGIPPAAAALGIAVAMFIINLL